MSSRWITLDLTRPLAHAREVAGVGSQVAAGALLGMAPSAAAPWTCSTYASREQRAAKMLKKCLLSVLEALGLEVEIRVRRR